MQTIIVIGCITAGMLLSIYLRKLTVLAALAGAVLAVVIYLGSGLAGLLSLSAFFVMGTAATAWKSEQKIAVHGHVPDATRNPGQVLANAGTATICSLLALFLGDPKFVVMTVCCFSAAAADTISSELGTLYGRRFYDIITFERGVRGNNGVVSAEGTLAGVIASSIIGFIYFLFEPSFAYWLVIAFAGTAGNLADSLLGATLENRGRLSNDLVNFLNTVAAAVIALMLL